MNELPIYDVILSDSIDGVYRISLVDMPAIEKDFIFFSKDAQYDLDEDKHIIFGPILRADFNIYRRDDARGEYYVRFSKEVIAKMTEKLLKDSNYKNINIMHGDDAYGIEMTGLFVKDIKRGIDPAGFDDCADGSLFGSFKVYDENVWENIKAGQFKGFSVEALYDLTLNEFEKIEKQDKNMTIKEFFSNLLCKYRQVDAGNTTYLWAGDEDIKIGDQLYIVNADGEPVLCEDGDYEIDNHTVTVKEGVVTMIDEEKPEDNTPAETKEEPSQEFVEETPEETPDATLNEIDELKARVNALETEIQELDSALAAVNELLTKPAAEPIVDEYTAATKNVKSNGAGKYLAALKK